MALGLFELVALGDHAVELIDEEIHGLVAFVGGNGGVEVGTVHGDVALGGEAVGDRLFGVALKLHAHADDTLIVTEQSVGFVVNKLLQGRSEF